MKERDWIEPIVERVVGQVLDNHVAQLRAEIVRQVVEEIAVAPALSQPASAPTGTSTADLARAISEIQIGSSQREILRALLDASARYAQRVALFVVKGTHATGWQGRGFANDGAIKDFALDDNAPSIVRAIGSRISAEAPVAEQDARFVSEFGAPANGEGRILPLLLKDKVAALVYADGGTEGRGLFDAGSLELLVLSTSAWLEINSLRKQAQKEPAAAQPEPHAATAQSSTGPTMQPAPAFNDPFAAHAPGHAMAAAASAAVSAPHIEATASTVEAEPLPLVQPPALTTAETEPSASAPPNVSSEDQEVHRKAQRFARLLVDEIKLYNQAKVAEGRKNKDLYDRLKEVIDKSRATYQKRYGNTVAASGNYFQNEMVRSLAEDDLSIMGSNFRQ
jgi:hypothetical protein